ncbi:sensor histidine kinase [Rhizobium sp. BK251]|uniref:sensor histidine kinase n=1 Tax=Rhizobium sp. BK251 TaxID=2512125 RepID=UPI00104F7ECF|nr:sensor histidine kinase [Rhizobium sp. BK251]TCL69635.1 two-component sensor histidine kinase [Rhizobium sp. BK251]
MALAVALPILAFVALLLMQLENNERNALKFRTIRDAQSLSRTIDRQLQDMATTLRLLSFAPELIRGDFGAFHDRTATALRTESLYALVVDTEGNQLLNTRRPYGDALGKMSNLPSLQAALTSGRIEASDVFMGATSGQWVYNVTFPLDQPSKAGALILTQNTRDLARLIAVDALPPGWSAAVLDSSGHVVAAAGAAGLSAGETFDPRIVSQLIASRGALDQEDLLPRQVLGYAQLPGWSWKAIIWGPIASAQESLLTTWRLLIIGGLVLLAIAILAAYAVARQVRSTIRSIANMANKLGQGEIVSPVETSVVEANQVAIALSNASFDRSQTEDRLHFLMHELVHRSKNLLTLVQAITRQLARQNDTVDQLQAAIADRLEGLARSIEVLTSEQWSGVSLRKAVEFHLEPFAQSKDRLEIVGKDFLVKPEAVQNLGLALHELATNSVKYGALSVPEGRVHIEWTDIEEEGEPPQIRLVWEESNGPPVNAPTHSGFGTTVIKTHAAAAFSGTVQVDFRREGLLWVLTASRASLVRD